MITEPLQKTQNAGKVFLTGPGIAWGFVTFIKIVVSTSHFPIFSKDYLTQNSTVQAAQYDSGYPT